MRDNRLNPGIGRSFQKSAAKLLSRCFGVELLLDHPIPIGSPPKEHHFDLASQDLRYVGECKSYSWTESGNVPSAKMGFVNEAVFYLTFLPSDTVRFIAMRKDTHPKKRETVAGYYYRTYRHLLHGITIIEIDLDSSNIKEFG